jgi:WD40 repeat protein
VSLSNRSCQLVLSIFILLHPELSAAQSEHPVLEFAKKIGVGWKVGKPGWMSFVSYSPDGTMVASDGPADPDDVSNNLTLWRFADGQLVKRLSGRPAAISPDWKYYATNHSILALETARPLIELDRNSDGQFVFSPDSQYVAVTGMDRTDAIRVFELPTGRQVRGFGRSHIYGLAISPDSRTLAAGYWGLVTLWDLATGERLGVLRGFSRYVVGLSFSADGKLLAGGTDAGELQIWDVANRARIASIDIDAGESSVPAFSPDSRRVAVGFYGSGAVWLIDVNSGKAVDRWKVSDLGCGSVAFSPDGRYLITPSTGGLITWPYDQGGTIRVFKVNQP